jgi:hypothetical protein
VIELANAHQDGDGDSLMTALRRDPDLRKVQLTPIVRQDDGGTMGGVIDGIVTVFGAGGIAVAVVQSVSAWLNSRRSEVTVKLTMDGGRAVEYSIKTHRDPREIIRMMAVEAERVDDGTD